MRVLGGGRRLVRLCVIGALPLALAACPSPQPDDQVAAGDSLHVRVLATHDFHGALRPVTYAWSGGRRIGGAAALKAAMDSAEVRCGCPTFRLDGGDQMQGSLESNLVHGASVVQAFNLIGLDAAAVGNHELDWGVDTLLVRQSEAEYSWLAANVFRVDDGERPEWATPYTVLEREGVRVAVLGWATVSTPLTLRPAVTEPYEFRRGFDAIRDALEAALRHDPDFTIIAAHAGGDCGEDGCSGEMVELAVQLPPGSVDLIVGGHDHIPGEGVVNGIPIVRGGSHGRAVAVVDLILGRDGSRTFRIARETVYADAVGQDTAMLALMEPYRLLADSLGRVPVARLGEALPARSTPRLGHLIADAARVSAGTDFGLYNPGGIRAALPAGKVTFADLYRVLPFGDAVVRLSLSGRELREVVERGLGGARVYYFSNLRVEYDPAARAGARVVSLTFADGAPTEEDRLYTLATVSFLADGGDGFDMLVALPAERSGGSLLDAVIAHLRTLPDPVTAPDERRVIPVR